MKKLLVSKKCILARVAYWTVMDGLHTHPPGLEKALQELQLVLDTKLEKWPKVSEYYLFENEKELAEVVERTIGECNTIHEWSELTLESNFRKENLPADTLIEYVVCSLVEGNKAWKKGFLERLLARKAQ